MELRSGQYTNRGPRANNQDAVRINEGLAYAALADGMGGPAGGAEASRMAIEMVDWLLQRELLEARRVRAVPDLLRRTFEEANRWVMQKALATPELRGMGTTLVLLVFCDSHYHLAHAGDSRAYLIRGGQLLQLTRDHSVVQARLDAGLIKPEEVAVQPDRNVITRAVGAGSDTEPELNQGEVYDEDTFVLTSDGVHGVVPPERILELAGANPQNAAEDLVNEALRLRTTDNSTAAVVRARSGRPLSAALQDAPSEPARPLSFFQRILGR